MTNHPAIVQTSIRARLLKALLNFLSPLSFVSGSWSSLYGCLSCLRHSSSLSCYGGLLSPFQRRLGVPFLLIFVFFRPRSSLCISLPQQFILLTISPSCATIVVRTTLYLLHTVCGLCSCSPPQGDVASHACKWLSDDGKKSKKMIIWLEIHQPG